MNIFLLRHGETDFNRAGRLQGHMDIPLNQNGRTQVSHAAEILTGLNTGIDLIISSPLSRAYESAEIVAEKLAYKKENIVVEPMLIERSFGAGEGLTIKERTEKYVDDLYPEMELLEDLLKRAHSVFEKIIKFADKQNTLVAAHGAILYAIVTTVTNGQIAYGSKVVKFDPGSIHLIRYWDGKIKLSKYCEAKERFADIEFNLPLHEEI